MSLWQRTPREVYRVYGEDEYLADDGQSTGEPARARPGQADGEHGRSVGASSQSYRSQGRLIGLGLLMGVTVGAVALVVLNISHRSFAAPHQGVRQSAPAQVSSSPPVPPPTPSDVSVKPDSTAEQGAKAHTRWSASTS